MNRRELCAGLIVLAGAPTSMAHTPYGQWVVYRKKHLLIGAHRAEPATYVLAQKLVGILTKHLPKAASRIARAPTAARLASLIGTDQLDVAVLSHTDATAMSKGVDTFAPYGPIALRILSKLDRHLLVAHQRFPARHAWLVTAALDAGAGVDAKEPLQNEGIPWHEGSLAHLEGKPEPD